MIKKGKNNGFLPFLKLLANGNEFDQHMEVARFQQLSIDISFAQFRQVVGKLWEKNSTWKTEWSSSWDVREVQLLHRVQFRRLCVAMKAERMISPFSKLHKNDWELEKTFYMKFFRILHSFPTVYYLPHSDEVYKNYSQKTISAIFKINIKP